MIGKGQCLSAMRASRPRDQKLDLQHQALQTAGCERIFEDTAGGAAERPALREALAQLRAGDTVVVWRLDRLGRSLKDLIAHAESLRTQGVGLRSLKEAIDTDSSAGQLVFHHFRRAGGVRAGADPRTHARRPQRRPRSWARRRPSQATRRGPAPPCGGTLPVAAAHHEGYLRARGDLPLDAVRIRGGVRGSRWIGPPRPRSPLRPRATAVERTCGTSVASFGGVRDSDRSPRGLGPGTPGLAA